MVATAYMAPNVRPEAMIWMMTSMSGSEIGFDDFGARHQFAALARPGETAIVEKMDAVGLIHDALGILLDDKDRQAGAAQIEDDPVDLVDDDGRKPQRWLVQHQKIAARHEAAADAAHAPLAARERAGDLIAAVLELGQQ